MVVVLLALDLVVFNAEAHEPTLRESALLTLFWTSLALIFNGFLWWWLGGDVGQAFFLGYLVEWSLSMDNVFIFFLVFTFFGVPLKYQHRVLFWGILGAVVMRLSFVVGATALIHWVEWILPAFGAFLIFTGVKMLFMESEVDPENNYFLRIARAWLPVAEGSHGQSFFVVQDGKTMVTSLFLVLLVVESTDLIFAVDSVPTIIGVIDSYPSLHNTSAFMFIAFTSNVFAILGLRALYFLLAGSAGLLRYLNFGLSAVLIFIGGKMIAEYIYEHWFREPDKHHKLIEPWVSLVVICGVLSIAVIASIIANIYDPPSEHEEKEGHALATDPHDPPGDQPAHDPAAPST